MDDAIAADRTDLYHAHHDDENEGSSPTAAHGGGDIQSARPSKRRKDGRVRFRVTRACDRCKARKTRCSGKYPCQHCSRTGLDCQFTAVYRRGRLPSIETETDESILRASMAGSMHRVTMDGHEDRTEEEDEMAVMPIPSPVSIVQNTSRRPRITVNASAGLQPPGEVSVAPSSRNSPEPSQSDQQGHYVGPASGASFLLRLQHKLSHQKSSLSSESSIFTFGDLPLPEFDSSFLVLPPRPEAEALVARYFDFACATHRFLHQHTVEGWLRELYETSSVMKHRESRTALLFMVFASAISYSKSETSSSDKELSAKFFSAAEHQLSKAKGEIRLTSVQARLAQCFYLLSHSRINHCWSLFGTTSHLMLALGIHRKRRVDQNLDLIDLECRKRTFWCAYNLSTYLSAALGRPRTFHDEDIDQELPSLISDSELQHRSGHQVLSRTQSIMTGPIAHLKLTQTLAHILRDMYGIRTPSSEERLRIAAGYDRELLEWRNGLSYFLDTEGVDPSLFLPLFLRQRNVLNLAFWHAQLLVHRPFLLSNFADLTNHSVSRRRQSSSSEVNAHVRKCLKAALCIVKCVDDLSSTNQLYSTFWFTHYFAFCAIVILYIYVIQQEPSSPENYLSEFHAAARCQSQITNIAIKGSLAERYGLVLQELRLEILKKNPYLMNENTLTPVDIQQLQARLDENNINMGNATLHAENMRANMQVSLEDADGFPHLGMNSFDGPSPSNSITQLAGWGQFDSLATGGIGGIESLLADEMEMQTWNL